MLQAIFLSFVLAAPAAAAPKRAAENPKALLSGMAGVSDKLDALLTELEEPSVKKNAVRYAAALEELSKEGVKAEALVAKADKVLKLAKLPQTSDPVALRPARSSWAEPSEVLELGGARLNVLNAQYSLLALALSSEFNEGKKYTCRGELAKARETLAKLKK